MHSRGSSLEEMRALLYAYSRRFREAAQLLQAMNAEQKALEMFADLRMFDQAQVCVLCVAVKIGGLRTK